MSFDSNLLISGEEDLQFGIISIQGQSSVRQNMGSSGNLPDTLTISHETKGKGDAAVDRHLIRFDLTKAYDGGGANSPRLCTASLYLVVVEPRVGVNQDEYDELWRRLKQFFESNGSPEGSPVVRSGFRRFITGEF